MQDLNLLGGTFLVSEKRRPRRIKRSPVERAARPGPEDIRRPHGAQVTNQGIERWIGDLNPVDIDNRRFKAGFRQEPGKSRGFDPWMNMRARLPGNRVGSKHRRAQSGEALPARNGADQQPARLKDQMQGGRGERQVVGRVEQANAEAKVELPGLEGQTFQICSLAAGLPCEPSARINDLNSPLGQAIRP